MWLPAAFRGCWPGGPGRGAGRVGGVAATGPCKPLQSAKSSRNFPGHNACSTLHACEWLRHPKGTVRYRGGFGGGRCPVAETSGRRTLAWLQCFQSVNRRSLCSKRAPTHALEHAEGKDQHATLSALGRFPTPKGPSPASPSYCTKAPHVPQVISSRFAFSRRCYPTARLQPPNEGARPVGALGAPSPRCGAMQRVSRSDCMRMCRQRAALSAPCTAVPPPPPTRHRDKSTPTQTPLTRGRRCPACPPESCPPLFPVLRLSVQPTQWRWEARPEPAPGAGRA